MQKDSILYILDSNGVSEEHLEIFSMKLKDKKFSLEDCDKLLVKLGYEKLFIIDEFSENDEEIDYDTYEKNKPKSTFLE